MTAAKRKEKEKKGRRNKNSKNRKALTRNSLSRPKTISKLRFLLMPESQCGKTRCWWQEWQAVVLQTHFRPD